MNKHLSLLMGIPESASPNELKKRYQKLMTALLSEEGENSVNSRKYKEAREKLSGEFESFKPYITNTKELPKNFTPLKSTLLGEILIDAGKITREQLDDALQAQNKSEPSLPLGRILVNRKLISWEELAYYLKLQDLMQLAPSSNERLSRQLLELGLISQNDLEIAILDCETTKCSLHHAIGRRGWIKPTVLAALSEATLK